MADESGPSTAAGAENRVRLSRSELAAAVAKLSAARATQLEAEAANVRAEAAQRVLVLHLAELAEHHGLRGEVRIDPDEGVLVTRGR